MENMPIIPIYTKDEQKRLDKISLEKDEKYVNDIESTGEFISNLLKKNGVYTETYQLNDRNEIDKDSVIAENAGRNILEMIKTADISIDGLSALVSDITKRFPNIKFSAKVDEKNLILNFENKINKGAMVNWVSQDTNQWDEPRKISGFSEDGEFAFVDGSNTGVPVSQLELVN